MDEWSKKRLIEITKKIGSGATPRGGSDSYKDFGISLFRSLNVHDRTFKEKNLAFIDEAQANKLSNVEVKEGDVLLNITGASIARCCVAPSELLPARVNQHVAIIRPKSDYIDSNFLVYLLVSKQYKDALLNTGEKAGSTRQALTKQQLENFEVTIPKLSEQKRIVAILDEAFEGIDRAIANTEKNLANSRKLFESYLNAIFTQKGGEWEKKTLQEISIKFTRGKSKHRPRGDKKLYGGKYPLIQTGDISNAKHRITNYSQTYNELGLAQSAIWPQGTVCIAIVGANVAETAILDFDACFPDSVIGIVVNNEIADSDYVEYLLQSFKKELKEKGKGTARDNINLGTFANQRFPFPDVKIQKIIACQLEELSFETKRLEIIYQQKITALKELKQSILQKAFTGELTADTPKAAKEGIAA
ncbi:restriction endonuclease subunit S [uncultured Nostoc sp.]|uniref:restriction endonuclease subunit S n=1 Tax=uncultured Nostoc sp. TaxID=340711 RepID=UPI0035CB0E9D